MRQLMALPRKWLIVALLLGATALTGGLWASQASTSIEVTAGNPAAEGRIATVSPVATTPIFVTTGKKGKKGKDKEVRVKKF